MSKNRSPTFVARPEWWKLGAQTFPERYSSRAAGIRSVEPKRAPHFITRTTLEFGGEVSDTVSSRVCPCHYPP